MPVDEVGSLREDDRLDDRLDRLLDDLADPVAVPAPGQAEDGLPDPVQLLFARAEVEVDELAVERTQHGATVDQATVVEGPAEGDHRRLRDDRLVEVEECGLQRAVGGGDRTFDRAYGLGLFAVGLQLHKGVLVDGDVRLARLAPRPRLGLLADAAAIPASALFRGGGLRSGLALGVCLATLSGHNRLRLR